MLKSLRILSKREILIVTNIAGDDFGQARQNMVQNQLVPSQIVDPVLLQAMSEIPRHLFVNERYIDVAYVDTALPVTNKRRLLAPLLFARMVEACKIEKTHKILDIGCGFGYSSIVMSQMAEVVVGIDNDPDCIARAEYLAGNFGATNCFFKTQDLFSPYAKEYFFDVIFINGVLHKLPDSLTSQLNHRGRIIVIEPSAEIEKLILYQKSSKGMVREEICTACADFLE